MFFREFLKKSFLVILFLAVPIFFALFGSRLMFGDVEHTWKEKVEERLGEILGETDSDKDPIVYYSRFFRQIEARAFSEKDQIVPATDGQNPLRGRAQGVDPKSSTDGTFLKGVPATDGTSFQRDSWKKITRLLKKKFPGQIEVVFLDGSGKPVAELTERSVAKVLTQKLFSAYQAFLREKKVLPETVQAFMKNFLGHFIPVDHEVSGILYYASGAPKECYVYFSRPHPEGMFFLFFKPAKPLEEMALREKLQRLARASSDVKLCLAIRGEKEKALQENLGLPNTRGWSLWKALQESENGKIWVDEVLVGRRVISPGYWVLAAISPAGKRPRLRFR